MEFPAVLEGISEKLTRHLLCWGGAILGNDQKQLRWEFPNLVVLNLVVCNFYAEALFAPFCAHLRSFADLRLRSLRISLQESGAKNRALTFCSQTFWAIPGHRDTPDNFLSTSRQFAQHIPRIGGSQTGQTWLFAIFTLLVLVCAHLANCVFLRPTEFRSETPRCP